MPYIEPNTTISFLTNIPFDPTYENTMYFTNPDSQTEWMRRKVVYEFNKNSYQRKNRGWLRVGWDSNSMNNSVIQLLYASNYMMFKNSNFENRWFYAFVDAVEYVNNNTVDVKYHIDVIQTWMFDWKFNQCLIEREHTTTDTVGSNLLPENLEIGEYIIDNVDFFPYTPVCVVVCTFDPYEVIRNQDFVYKDGYVSYGRTMAGPSGTGNMFTGLSYIAFDLTDSSHVTNLNNFLGYTNTQGRSDGIVAMYMMPQEFYSMDGSSRAEINRNYSIQTSLSGYTPRNKKLLTWPYNGLYVSNMQGDSTIYKYEYFLNQNNITLVFWGNMSTNPGIMCYPFAYKSSSSAPNYDEAITLTGFPMCAWANDAFIAWIAQNTGYIKSKAANAGITGLMSLLNVGAYYGQYGKHQSGRGLYIDNGEVNKPTLASAAMQAYSLLGQVQDHQVAPPQSHGSGNGNLQYQSALLTFMVARKHIRAEFAKIIDSYFDMYGYASHRVGYPRINTRPCYTYVKTVGCSIDGNFPNDDARAIEDIFNNGIRFWKTSASFGSFDPAVNNNQV